MNLGTLIDGLGCFPFDHGAYPPQSDCLAKPTCNSEFDCIQYLQRGHQTFSALPSSGIPDASPKAISRRTSYLPTRLEFLPYPQLIRGHCNERRFGPPVDFTQLSSWPWIDRRVSGLRTHTNAQLRLGFPTAPPLRLNPACERNSPAHSSIGTSSGINAL